MDQRSPKSETSTQERHGGTSNSGMGRKSNSTSQLSATGNLSKSLSIPLYYPVIFLSLNEKKEDLIIHRTFFDSDSVQQVVQNSFSRIKIYDFLRNR